MLVKRYSHHNISNARILYVLPYYNNIKYFFVFYWLIISLIKFMTKATALSNREFNHYFNKHTALNGFHTCSLPSAIKLSSPLNQNVLHANRKFKNNIKCMWRIKKIYVASKSKTKIKASICVFFVIMVFWIFSLRVNFSEC